MELNSVPLIWCSGGGAVESQLGMERRQVEPEDNT